MPVEPHTGLRTHLIPTQSDAGAHDPSTAVGAARQALAEAQAALVQATRSLAMAQEALGRALDQDPGAVARPGGGLSRLRARRAAGDAAVELARPGEAAGDRPPVWRYAARGPQTRAPETS